MQSICRIKCLLPGFKGHTKAINVLPPKINVCNTGASTGVEGAAADLAPFSGHLSTINSQTGITPLN
jgi:hypothetical protein